MEKLRYAAEMVLNFMEHLVLQKANLREDWPVWKAFILATFRSAPVVRAALELSRDIYASELYVLAKESD